MYRAVNIKRKMCSNGVGGGEGRGGVGGSAFPETVTRTVPAAGKWSIN